MSKFIDFEDTNVIWCWQLNENGEYFFDKYDVNNAMAGDTDSIMLMLHEVVTDKNHDIQDVVDLADDIGGLVNDSFPDFCKFAFNCPDSRRDAIKTDREIVSDKSLFLSKKRYIMHVVDKEGKRGSDLKIMGVEIKKSNTSKAIKKMLMDLVNYILDGYSEEEVLAKVKQMKEDFTSFSIPEIATPINVKTLKKCQDMLQMTGDKKGFPYQVRAAMFWNDNCTLKDRAVMPGEKIGLVYIRNPSSKYVGFPIDIMSFPEWFDDFLIDYDTEWSKAHKKLEAYLSSIGWDIKGRKQKIKQELFGF